MKRIKNERNVIVSRREEYEKRTEELQRMNLRVLRICNLDIDRNFRGVCEFLDIEVRKSLPQSPAVTAPSSEGAVGAQRIAE